MPPSWALALEGRIDHQEAEYIVAVCEPTGYGTGYLRWHPKIDGTVITLPKILPGEEVETIFPALKDTKIDSYLPLSLEWLVEKLSGLRYQVGAGNGSEVSVRIGSISGDEIPLIDFTYRRHMALWLTDEEDRPLRPKQIRNLYVDYRLRSVAAQGNHRQRSELQRAAALFIMLDIWLSAYVVAERHDLDIPDLNLEVDIDETKLEIVEMSAWLVDAFQSLISIEGVDDEITCRVPFKLITIADIHVD
jgi:hypothetical protein